MKTFKYLLFSCLFFVTNDALSAAAAAAPADNIISMRGCSLIRLGSSTAIKSIAEKKGFNAVDKNGNPLLCLVLEGDADYIKGKHNEVLRSKLEEAKWLIEQGANIEGKNEFGLTPFLLAINKFMPGVNTSLDDKADQEFNKLRFDFIKFLISKGVNLNAVDRPPAKADDIVEEHDALLFGPHRNFLMIARDNNDTELVEFLCSLGVITQQMYEAVVEVHQRDVKPLLPGNVQAARPSWLYAVSLPEAQRPIFVTIRAPNAAGAAAAAGAGADGAAAMAAGDAAQKESNEVVNPKGKIIDTMRIYLSYANGALRDQINQNIVGSDGTQVPALAALAESFIFNPVLQNGNVPQAN